MLQQISLAWQYGPNIRDLGDGDYRHNQLHQFDDLVDQHAADLTAKVALRQPQTEVENEDQVKVEAAEAVTEGWTEAGSEAEAVAAAEGKDRAGAQAEAWVQARIRAQAYVQVRISSPALVAATLGLAEAEALDLAVKWSR